MTTMMETNEVESSLVSEEVPETSQVSEEVPETSQVSEEVPETNEVSEEVPETNEVSEEVPDHPLTREQLAEIARRPRWDRYKTIRAALSGDPDFDALPNHKKWEMVKYVAYAAGFEATIRPVHRNRTPEAYKEMFRQVEGRSPRRPGLAEQEGRWLHLELFGRFATYEDIDQFHLEHPSPTGKRNWRMFINHMLTMSGQSEQQEADED